MASELAAALAKVQAELPRIKKDKTAHVPTKSGGSYEYKYADLADVSDAILPVLARHGLAWSCLPLLRDDGQFVLRYHLRHASGDELTGDYPLDRGTAQQNGGMITYARRYALGAVTGVATDEDTDGRGEQGATRQRQAKPRAEPNGRPAERSRGPIPAADEMWAGQPPGELPKPPAYSSEAGTADEEQLRTIHIQLTTLGVTDRDDQHTRIEKIINGPLTTDEDGERTSKNLSRAEAETVKTALAEAIKAKKLAERAGAAAAS